MKKSLLIIGLLINLGCNGMYEGSQDEEISDRSNETKVRTKKAHFSSESLITRVKDNDYNRDMVSICSAQKMSTGVPFIQFDRYMEHIFPGLAERLDDRGVIALDTQVEIGTVREYIMHYGQKNTLEMAIIRQALAKNELLNEFDEKVSPVFGIPPLRNLPILFDGTHKFQQHITPATGINLDDAFTLHLGKKYGKSQGVVVLDKNQLKDVVLETILKKSLFPISFSNRSVLPEDQQGFVMLLAAYLKTLATTKDPISQTSHLTAICRQVPLLLQPFFKEQLTLLTGISTDSLVGFGGSSVKNTIKSIDNITGTGFKYFGMAAFVVFLLYSASHLKSYVGL